MITLIPAYGRDYNSKQEVETAFNDNKDFLIADVFNRYYNKPVNKNDLVNSSMASRVKIRYNKKTKVHIIAL
jgi:hypothetical protein